MPSPSVSVVIPTCNGGARFHSCLMGVLSQDYDGEVDVLVIDSCSTDGTAEYAHTLGEPRVRVIDILREEFDHGLTRALGVRNTTGELVAFLTQDAVPADNTWLAQLAACFTNDRVAGAYSRQTPLPNANPLVRARLNRWAAGSVVQREQRIDDWEAFMELPQLARVPIVAFDNVASCVRRSIWEQIPFQASAFGEDTQWSLAVLKAGYSIMFEPASQVEHSHNPTLWYEFRRVYLDHQNWKRLIDLTLFPRWPEIIPASVNGARAEMAAIRNQDLTRAQSLYWQAYAVPFVFVQNAAQFWGALSVKWLRTKPWFRGVDRRLRRGI